MRDGPVRRTVKRAASVVFSISLWVSRRHAATPGNVHYDLGGECRRSGRCCEAPAMRVGWLVWFAPILRWVFLEWQHHVNGFVLVERRRRERTFVFRCTHFDRNTRLCDSYSSRPGMCRDYPRSLMHQSAPQLFVECGYRALSPKRHELLQVLEAKSLDDQQLERLKKTLYLE